MALSGMPKQIVWENVSAICDNNFDENKFENLQSTHQREVDVWLEK